MLLSFEFKFHKKGLIEKSIHYLLFICLVLLILFINFAPLYNSKKDLSVEKVELLDFRSRNVKLTTSNKNKILIFWNKNCKACKKEIRFLKDKMNRDKDLDFYFVNDKHDSFEEFRNYITNMKMEDSLSFFYPNVFKEIEEITKNGVPVTILIGKDNKVLKQWDGFSLSNADALKSEIEEEIE